MGLDMYLYAKKRPEGQKPRSGSPETYQSDQDYEKEVATLRKADPDFNNVFGYTRPDGSKLFQQPGVQEVAYWRKANQIHRYFVTKTANGMDECEPSFVHPDVLHGLMHRCRRILAAEGKERIVLAQELLPTIGGFFFGSTEYDEGYFWDLENTLEQLTKVFNTVPEDCDLIYRASW